MMAPKKKPNATLDFTDSLKMHVLKLLDAEGADVKAADKVKAIEHGIALAKLCHEIDQGDDDGMGFAQR